MRFQDTGNGVFYGTLLGEDAEAYEVKLTDAQNSYAQNWGIRHRYKDGEIIFLDKETTEVSDTKPRRYRKLPVEIEAMHLDSNNYMDVYKWVENNTDGSFEPMDVIEGRKPCPASGVSIDPRDGRMMIATLEGFHHADFGDYVIRGVKGEFYPCKPDIFEMTYKETE